MRTRQEKLRDYAFRYRMSPQRFEEMMKKGSTGRVSAVETPKKAPLPEAVFTKHAIVTALNAITICTVHRLNELHPDAPTTEQLQASHDRLTKLMRYEMDNYDGTTTMLTDHIDSVVF